MRPICAVGLALLALILARSVVADEGPTCYSRNGMATLPIQKQTVILIDRTTPLDIDARSAFDRTMRRALLQPGQRVVVLTFAALARGENVTKLFDETTEPPNADSTLIDSTPVGPYRRSQHCVIDRQRKVAGLAGEAVAKAFATMLKDGGTRSEIVYTLRRVLAAFATPSYRTDFLVFSDGVENSASGHSFYAAKKPRAIDASKELARLNVSDSASIQGGPIGTVNVIWFGLLASETAHHEAPATTESYREFWTRYLRSLGVATVTIDLAPLDVSITTER